MPKILFVEDNETVRKSYTGLLTQAGFEVTAVEDSAAALKQFELSSFDLAILDIALGNDQEAGFHLCTEIRKRSETLPIIFLTALDSDLDKISGMRLGADDYLTKDVNPDYLIVRVKALLRRMAVLSKQNRETAEILARGDLSLNMDTLTASWKNKLVNLSLTNTLTTHIANIRKHFQAVDPQFAAIKSERGAGYRWFVG